MYKIFVVILAEVYFKDAGQLWLWSYWQNVSYEVSNGRSGIGVFLFWSFVRAEKVKGKRRHS